MTFAFHFRSLISEHTITVDLLSNLVGINTELYCVLLRICSSLLGKSSAQQQQRGQFTDGRPNDYCGRSKISDLHLPHREEHGT